MNILARTSTPAGVKTSLLIDNVDHAGKGELLRVVNPVTEELVAEFPAASPAQVNEAVAAAKRAFDSGVWKNAEFRRATLHKLADLIAENRDRLMDALIAEIGTPINLMPQHVDAAVSHLRWAADAAIIDRTRNLGLSPTNTGVTTIYYRPIGVVAAISAFNYPLFISCAKIGSSLAAGCPTVLLSSPLAPLTIFLLNDLVRKAGFPPGVVNILAGAADVGRALTEHPDIAKISFTGSVNVGRQVMQQAAAGLRSVVLELGGKGPAIMLPDVDYGKYAFGLHARYARHAGQGCGSPTRILIEESRYDEFAKISREVYPKLTVGDPRDPATVLGPVITSAQRDRIESAIAHAVGKGAQVIAGGGRPDIKKGWFINPTLIGRLDNKATIAREELFGPVSVVLTYRTLDEAIQIANDSDLGLKAFIFGKTSDCLKIAPELCYGTVQINGGSPNRPDSVIVGYKNSGVGSEWGEDGLREFLRPQHIDCLLA